MLSKKNRVDKKLTNEIFKKGRFINSSNLTLKFFISASAKNNDKKAFPPRVSFITPKTVSKNAVVRVLLRRRGYAVLQRYLCNFPAGFAGAFVFGKNGLSVFGGRKNKENNPIKNLENEIKEILHKIY